MESKVREYQDLYETFEYFHEQALVIENPIYELEKEIEEIQEEQKNVDYKDNDTALWYMNAQIEDSIKHKKEEINNEVDEKMEDITEPEERVAQTFKRIKKWIPEKKIKKILESETIDFKQNVQLEKAEREIEFNLLNYLNKLLSIVFRFDFLSFLPKVARNIIGSLFWAFFLLPKIVSFVLNSYKPFLESKLAELSEYEYKLANSQAVYEQFKKEFAMKTMLIVAIVFIGIIALNIGVYIATKRMAKRFIIENKALCLAFVSPAELKEKMYQYYLNQYMENEVAEWKQEIEIVKMKGLEGCGLEETSMAKILENFLREEYDKLQEKIEITEKKIQNIREKSREVNVQMQFLIPELQEMEKEVRTEFVQDRNFNHAVLLPYVSAGYSQYTLEGVKELIFFEHNYKPMVICYEEDTTKEGERFRRNMAKLIELLMIGFTQENYYDNLQMWLVDFEGLYFPESRTQGIMKVVRTQGEVQQMFAEIKNARKMADTLEDGRIRNINPARLARRENPIKYNIVYFAGYDFSTVDREIAQLFIDGENFGFLPIIFMAKDTAQVLLKRDNFVKQFSKVMEKAKDNRQIYSFEDIVAEFEYDVVVSNRKPLLYEKCAVRKVISTQEFLKAAKSKEGFLFDHILYADWKAINKDIHERILDRDDVQMLDFREKTQVWEILENKNTIIYF